MSASTTRAQEAAAPSAWIVRHAALVRPRARVLDVAAGRGRHARFFAARGAFVCAVDRADDALAALDGVAGVTTLVADLEAGPWPFEPARFDAIVVVNYLHRALFPALRAALAPGGVVLYETFMAGHEAFGRPSNPAFLLRRDELLDFAALTPPLEVIAFEQGRVTGATQRDAVVQRMAARSAPAGALARVTAPADRGPE